MAKKKTELLSAEQTGETGYRYHNKDGNSAWHTFAAQARKIASDFPACNINLPDPPLHQPGSGSSVGSDSVVYPVCLKLKLRIIFRISPCAFLPSPGDHNGRCQGDGGSLLLQQTTAYRHPHRKENQGNNGKSHIRYSFIHGSVRLPYNDPHKNKA